MKIRRNQNESRLKKPDLMLFASKLLRLDFNKNEDRAALYYVLEIFWSTFLDAAASFNAAYAIRLGASDQDIGYLSSIPALIAIAITIPMGRVLGQSRHKKKLVLSSLAVFRSGYVVIALLPWLKFIPIPTGTTVVIALIFFAATASLFNVGWTPMMAEVISKNRLAPVISMRMQIYHATRSLAVFLLGLWLDTILFPLNYQVMYLVTFGLSLISIFFVARIAVPSHNQAAQVTIDKEAQPSKKQKASIFSIVKGSAVNLVNTFQKSPAFARFTLNTVMQDFGMWAVNPLFTLFFVNNLGASDGWLGTFASVHSICNIAGYAIWRKIVVRYGETRMLKICSLFRPLYPLSIALLPNLTAILVIGGLWGLLIPGLGLSHSSTYIKMLPPGSREEAQSIYSTIQNISQFVSPLLGIAISTQIGIPSTLLIFAGVRLLGSLTWTLFPIDRKHPRVQSI